MALVSHMVLFPVWLIESKLLGMQRRMISTLLYSLFSSVEATLQEAVMVDLILVYMSLSR